MMCCFVLSLLLMSSFRLAFGSNCAPDLSSVGDSVITLSDELSDAYTAEERCEELGGYLAVTREADVNQTLTKAASSKFSGITTRVWIYYKSDDLDVYKYSRSKNEDSSWISPQHLGHMWYIDLYSSSTFSNASLPIRFCKSGNGDNIKWSVGVDYGCSDGWWEDFVLYGLPDGSSEAGYKAIYAYNQDRPPWSIRLTDVEDDNYNNFTNPQGTFYVPARDVFIGARYDVTSQQWKWSDGENATEFKDVGHTSCQQKVWDHEVNQISHKYCNKSKAYYSCQVIFRFSLNKIECNSTALQVSWNMLSLAKKYGKTLKVTIRASHIHPEIDFTNTNQTIISGLTPSLNYNISVTVKLDCDDWNDITSSQIVEMGPGSPNDVIYGHVIKSQDSCQIEFANPLPNGIFNVSTFIRGTADKTVQFSNNSCDANMCRLPIQLIDYDGLGKLSFKVSASNCEGETETKSVAGNCFAPDSSVPPACRPSLSSRGDSILALSDIIHDVTSAQNSCSSLGGALVTLDESELVDEIYPRLSETYLKDIQRVWIYRLKSDTQVYKYSFSNITDDNWESPSENDHLTYLDLHNRNNTAGGLLYFSNNKNTSWRVTTTSYEDGWTRQFALYGTMTAFAGYKKVYMFESTKSGSVKLKTNNSTDVSFLNKGEFYIPEINILVGEIISSDAALCPLLHYGESWKTLTNCTEKSAYFACAVPFIANVEPVECNSTILNVSWENNIWELLRKVPNLSITQVVIAGDEIAGREIKYNASTATIENLKQRTSYTLNISVSFEGCFSASIYTTLVSETSYGLADPVTNARVDQTSNVCTVIMPSDESGHVIKYVVEAKSSQNTTYQEYILNTGSTNSENKMQISFDSHDSPINLKIQAITCEGGNAFEAVEGYCTISEISVSNTGAIVGSICGVLAIVALCAASFLLYKRRQVANKTEEVMNSDSPTVENIHTYSNRVSVAQPCFKESLFKLFLSNSQNKNKDIQEEFKKIQEESAANQPLNEVSQRKENAVKNRYKNIYPMDHARVKLVGVENDYVNASYIAGYKDERKFIAAQGPRSATIDDFWMMVWQQNSPIIVMLTGLQENGKTKCEQYWPELGCSITFGNYKIKTLEENSFGGIVQRKFSVATIKEQRLVIQFHYIGWPDHGTPITTTSLIHLRKLVEENYDGRSPITVHCSAGVGRTGTYIAMDVLFDKIDNDEKVDFKKMVLKMRENRSEMVQNWKQYALIMKLVLEYVSLPDSDKTIAAFQTMTQAEIDQLSKKEFEVLKNWRYGSGWIQGCSNLEIYEDNVVKLWSDNHQEIMPMNASYIDDLKFGGNFIAAQCPEVGNEEKFWQMLLIRKINVVLCLMQENNALLFNQTNHRFGDIQLDVINSHDERTFTIHEVVIWSNREEPFEVCVIQSNTWQNEPPASGDLIKLIEKMQQMKAKEQGDYVLVCCKNGCDKTGTFIALVNILERLKSQNRVDVFRTIKDLRDMRPNMVDNLALYRYCYSVVVDYLSLFNAYDNFDLKAVGEGGKELGEHEDPLYAVPAV